MLIRIPFVIFSLVIIHGAASAQKIEAAKLDPVPSTEKQAAMIREGVAFHDKGDYGAAIGIYEDVLKENPDNISAIYEASFSCSLKKDYKKSLELAYKGINYKSHLLPQFYVVIGNNFDSMGEPQKSIDMYKSAIGLYPKIALLYFNLGITYAGQGKLAEARESLKQSAMLTPDHPSSHYQLGNIFYKLGYPIPATYALMRFLILEPRTERSVSALKLLNVIMQGGVTQGKNPNEINITLNLSAKKDEGDFTVLETMMGLTKAVALTKEGKTKSEIELFTTQMDSLLSTLSEGDFKKDGKKFTVKYYVPFFIELKRKNFVKPFCYYINQKSGLTGVDEWLMQNNDQVKEFLAWSKQYKWPSE